MTLGHSKHRRSGTAPKSPKLRYAMRLMAEGKHGTAAPAEQEKGKASARREAWQRKRKSR